MRSVEAAPSFWEMPFVVPSRLAMVSFAEATVLRASSMERPASSMPPERSSSDSRTVWMSAWRLEPAPDAPSRALSAAAPSLSEMTPATVPANVLFIWFSMVEAPVSVTFGATAFSFSFT